MQLGELTWKRIESLPREMPVVIPIAAVEQHSHHLPLATDSLLLQEVVGRSEALIGEQVLFTPLQWLGNSHHHLDFPGTLSADPRAYLDLCKSLVNNLLSHGFQRILVLNGHGGNDVPGKQAMFEIRQECRERDDLLLLFATYWSLADVESIPDLMQSEMGHACEWETSMMLRISPALVGDYLDLPTIDPGNPFRPAARAWITKDRSQVGHIGCPAKASAEKGEALLTKFTSGLCSMLNRMREWDGKSWEG
jgi:creatinine amidohydrolase